MPVRIIDRGKGNEIHIPTNVMEQQNATIVFRGNGNKLILGEGTIMRGAEMTFGNDCSFTSGAKVRLSCIQYNANRCGHVAIGDLTSFTWTTKIFLNEPGRIEIGAGCMIAGSTLLTVSDMHSIIDIETGQRINQARDISLGERVWLAAGVSVMKGSQIGAGSIIGYGAIVTGVIAQNSLAAGIPAKIIRSGVTWRPDLI